MKKASAVAAITEDLRNDMAWRWEMPSTRPAKRLPNLRDLATSMGESSVVAVYTDESSIRGWGAVLGDHFIQGMWSKLECREGINWEELRVLTRVVETWSSLLTGELVFVRPDNGTAASRANYGAGRVPQLTLLARTIKEREVAIGRTIAASYLAGKEISVADALPWSQ